jgi:hypothetical protein
MVPPTPRRLLVALVFTVPGSLAPAPARAQGAAKPAPSKAVFRQVIPRPTGSNGYEELVLAADTFRASAHYDRVQDPGLTLEQRRLILADRQVARSLELLRLGLRKPVSSPRETLSHTTLLPELGLFRGLSRLLALQQYVFLADGRVHEAIGNARLGLQFSQAVQTDTLVSGLVGVAMSIQCLVPLVNHLDQLSVRDCEALYQVCLDWLAQPNPQEQVMLSEYRWAKSGINDIRDIVLEKGAAGAAKEFGIEPKQVEPYLREIPTTAEALLPLFSEVQRRYDRHMERVFAEQRKPYWQRRPLETPEANDVAGRILNWVVPPFDRVDHAYIREAARIRILASHCAIHRYRWEHDRLPVDLSEARLGDLAVDPFTGQPLQYRARGRRYSLTSAGAPAPADDPKAVDGRIPISLTPDD